MSDEANELDLPPVVSAEEWLAARKDLLVKEKALTSARDELNTARRQLPMVDVTKQYTLHGAQGPVGLVDLFEGRDQLIVHHFMSVSRSGSVLGSLHHFLPVVASSSCAAADVAGPVRRGLIGAWHRPD
jgi:predicted dithiol-disulfide oxidoreductase (DUF899 family)